MKKYNTSTRKQDSTLVNVVQLHEHIVQNYGVSDLKKLFKLLGIGYNDIVGGDAVKTKSRNLITYMRRQERLPELAQLVYGKKVSKKSSIASQKKQTEVLELLKVKPLSAVELMAQVPGSTSDIMSAVKRLVSAGEIVWRGGKYEVANVD